MSEVSVIAESEKLLRRCHLDQAIRWVTFGLEPMERLLEEAGDYPGVPLGRFEGWNRAAPYCEEFSVGARAIAAALAHRSLDIYGDDSFRSIVQIPLMSISVRFIDFFYSEVGECIGVGGETSAGYGECFVLEDQIRAAFPRPLFPWDEVKNQPPVSYVLPEQKRSTTPPGPKPQKRQAAMALAAALVNAENAEPADLDKSRYIRNIAGAWEAVNGPGTAPSEKTIERALDDLAEGDRLLQKARNEGWRDEPPGGA